MKYLLDTNICIYFINGKVVVKENFLKAGINNLAISQISLAELYYGAHLSTNPEKNIKTILTFKENINMLSLDEESADIFGKTKSNLKKKGQIISDMDILIASIAISNDLILVTNNTKEFNRIDQLRLENWVDNA